MDPYSKTLRRKEIIESIKIFLFVYVVISFAVWFIRVMARDCDDRYVDYALPISFLHCEIQK